MIGRAEYALNAYCERLRRKGPALPPQASRDLVNAVITVKWPNTQSKTRRPPTHRAPDLTTDVSWMCSPRSWFLITRYHLSTSAFTYVPEDSHEDWEAVRNAFRDFTHPTNHYRFEGPIPSFAVPHPESSAAQGAEFIETFDAQDLISTLRAGKPW